MSTVLAVLASGCYSPDFGPYLSAVRLDVTEVTLDLNQTHRFTATVFPDDVNWARRITEVEWATSCGGSVISIMDRRMLSATIVAISPDAMATVSVTVTVGGEYLSAFSVVVVNPEALEGEI